MALPPKTLQHVLKGLSATPRVVELLVRGLKQDDPIWDRGHEGRFTLRESLAHLADWDEVFLERAFASMAADEPMGTDPDAGDFATERNYGSSNPDESIGRFADNRASLLAFFSSLPAEDWSRATVHPRHGRMTLEAQAVHILGHDGYHLKYLTELL